ncbi:hypothetical protein EPYR_02383 [Erwinia pyrifoliae DSM 12163]|nr:hypothetical protein EPYR_02383 [Erwinia pyrifoliae DSM 12163]
MDRMTFNTAAAPKTALKSNPIAVFNQLKRPRKQWAFSICLQQMADGFYWRKACLI